MISDLPRRIVLAVFDDAEALDLTGPSSAFAQANLLVGRPVYEVLVVGSGHEATMNGGLRVATTPFDGLVDHDHTGSAGASPIDTALVVGGVGFDGAIADDAFVEGFSRLMTRARRVGSICTGAFVLAATGALDGRRATTHWSVASVLAERHPEVMVDLDCIYVRDEHVWTSAGVTAGIDLTLAMIADDLGVDLAHEVARWLVLPARRSGGQSQYGPQLASAAPTSAELAPLLLWMRDHLDGDLSVAALARRAGWSERHLTRRFRAETGQSPARHVEDLRLDAARRLLETTELTVDAVAARCGLGGREVLHRGFRRRFGTTPASYRAQFVSARAPARGTDGDGRSTGS